MLEDVAGDEEIGVGAGLDVVAGANDFDGHAGGIEAGSDAALHLAGETFTLPLRGLIAELDADGELGVHFVGDRGHFHLVANGFKVDAFEDSASLR